MYRYSNPIATLANSLASAQYVDMPIIKDRRRLPGTPPYTGKSHEEREKWWKEVTEEYDRRPQADELYVVAMFLQTWGSTALGFGGVGGQAMTSAYVTVIGCDYNTTYCVYFGGRFAYALDMNKINTALFTSDIRDARMADVGKQYVYVK